MINILTSTGELLVTTGGGSGTVSLTQYRLAIGDASNVLSSNAAITGNSALISDVNGVPTHSSTTATELGYVSGVTSAIQTQMNLKATLISPLFVTPRLNATSTTGFIWTATDNVGNGSFQAAASVGLTVGTTTIASGTDARVLFDDAGVLGEDTGMVFNKTSNNLTVGSLTASNLTSGTVPVATTNGGLTDGLIISSGTYTPTLTNVANLDASTAFVCQYMRVGSVVTVSGKVNIDPTTPAASTQLGISLPITSNLANDFECAGTAFCATVASQGASIKGDITNNRAQITWISEDIAAQDMYFTFTYLII